MADDTGPRGIDVEPVTRWIVDHVGGVRPPLRFDLIAGGHSNLTYKVTDAAGRHLVLRRPPLGHVLPTAHDMTREWRCISALWPTEVPVPEPLALCTDPEVTGADFYVMGYVPGHVLHDDRIAREVFDAEQRRRAGESFIDVAAALHAVDPVAVGLGDLGKHEGYIERQLRRWYRQYQASITTERPLVDELYERLMASIPPQQGVAVVHGDYRLGNCICGPDGTIAAVLDWEICTLGDALGDLGYLLATWPDPGEDDLRPGSPSLASGFPTRAELVERYAARSDRDLSRIGWYMAWACWKSACIAQGVYYRYLGGALGEVDVDVEAFGTSVDRMAERAARLLDDEGV